jgi:hypothetical protein
LVCEVRVDWKKPGLPPQLDLPEMVQPMHVH